MKKLTQIALFFMLTLTSVFAFAGRGGNGDVPEIDGSLAILGLGLLSGVVALVAERRRSK